MARTKQKIYGYVDLDDRFRQWIAKQVVEFNKVQLARGWRVTPAHFRRNPTKDILIYGYPDTEDSHNYWFDNPEKRDLNGDLIREPLPIKSERDKDYFRQENEWSRAKYGFPRYRFLQNNRNYVQEYDWEQDFVEHSGKAKGMRPEIYANIGGDEDYIFAPVTKSVETESKYERGKHPNTIAALKKGREKRKTKAEAAV